MALSWNKFLSSSTSLTLTSTFINKFADNTKIGNAALSEQDRWSLQDDMHKISVWSEKWEIPLNINECHILQIGSKNTKMECEMCGVQIKGVHLVKDIGVTVSSNL